MGDKPESTCAGCNKVEIWEEQKVGWRDSKQHSVILSGPGCADFETAQLKKYEVTRTDQVSKSWTVEAKNAKEAELKVWELAPNRGKVFKIVTGEMSVDEERE